MSVYLWNLLFWLCGFIGGLAAGWVLWRWRPSRPSRPALLTRDELYTRAVSNGWLSPNQARAATGRILYDQDTERYRRVLGPREPSDATEVDEEYTWTRPAAGATNADSEHP